MSTKPSDRCSICGSSARWAVDNTYLADGSGAARSLALEMGFSHGAYYRHIKEHISLSVNVPPVDRSAIEWVRGAMALAAATEAYRIITDPGGIGDIAILVGNDDQQYIELAILYTEGSIDLHQVDCMAIEMNLDVEDQGVLPGIRPTHKLSVKLHTSEVFVGRRSVKRASSSPAVPHA